MKQFSIAASALLLTAGLAFLAISVAQRDSRNQMSSGLVERPDYVDQPIAPIEIQLANHAQAFNGDETESTNTNRPYEMDNGVAKDLPGNKLRPSLNEISSLRSPDSREGERTDATSSPDGQLTEPPRLAVNSMFSSPALPNNEGLQNQTHADSAGVNYPDSLDRNPEIDLVGAYEAVDANSSPSEPARLLPPPSFSAPTNTANVSRPSLMPPSLTSPINNASPLSGAREVAPQGFGVPSNSPPNISQPSNSHPSTAPSSDVASSNTTTPPSMAPAETQLLPATAVPSSSSPPPTSRLTDTATSPFSTPAASWPNSSIQSGSIQSAAPQRAPSTPATTVRSQPTAFNPPAQPFVNQLLGSKDILLASSAPGVRQLDGSQNPSLQIHKRAPEEVQVGHLATFTILVRNVGTATAYDVIVTDSVPRGTSLSKTNPPAQSGPDGSLIWTIGEMAAGSEQVLSIELVPETEGEIGSVANVTFAGQASVRTVSTQPKLTVQQSASGKVLLGQPIKIQISISNEGTGVARGVSLEEDVPPGLRHPLGSTLGVPLGDLVPGQSRTTQLELIGTEPGVVQNLLRAVSSNAATVESSVPIEIVAPQLKITAGGPKLRYLERQATYRISITNTGTAMAHNVEFSAYLPRGMQFNSAINDGEYIADQHAVTWGLEELAVGATAITEMNLLPVEEGDYVIRLQGRGDGVKSDPFEKPLRIEGQSELAFAIEDDNDPIETDEETTYTVKLTNNGTRIDQDVSLMIELPPGAKVLQVNAPVAYSVTQEGLLFEPIPQVKAKDQQTFRFSVQLTQEGTQVIRAHVKSKLRPLAVIKEESTQVYRDN